MNVLLDTNFIMTCIKQKIDFMEELQLQGFKIIIPKQVIEELERVSVRKNKKLKHRELAEISLKLIKKSKKIFTSPDLGKKHVDKLIVQYADKNPKLIVATLDSELKKKLKNKKMVIREKKQLEII